ncbi:MAG TPA: hypothetical protein VHC72_06050 [Bryobacteraceae bacterium]|nr:hypothetical protein [Bryobacteraceae bacterium]
MKTAMLAASLTAAIAMVIPAADYSPPRTPDGHPDLQGVWSNATIIPLERPKDLAGKRTFTEQEFAEYQKKVFARSNRDRPNQTGVGTYNAFWWDQGTKLAHNRNTSLIVDPADGRIPALTPAAQLRVQQDRAYARAHPADGPEDRPFMDRCLLFPTTGPPMLPSFYNGTPYGPLATNYQIVQSRDSLVIFVEHNHEARVIPLDGRPHLPPDVRQWLGDSRGHWEGDTLVIDTTNFTNKTKFKGSDENLHLTERFRRTGPDTLLYRFTIDDPTAFTAPWTGEYPFIASQDRIYEYACHEGNYGLAGVLAGARAAEKEAGEKEK